MDNESSKVRGRRAKNPDSPSAITHLKKLREGVAIYKTAESPFWKARVWNPTKKRYAFKSTKETSRLEAIEVAEEWIQSLYANPKFSEPVVAKDRTFEHFAKRVIMVNKLNDSRYTARDEEKLLNRKEDGLLEYFGERDIGTITSHEVVEYFAFLDDNRDKPMAPSTKAKHVIVLNKIFNNAAEAGAIHAIPALPKGKGKAEPRVSFTKAEYDELLKVAKACASKSIVVRKVPLDLQMLHITEFLVGSFLRPTVSELFALRNADIKELNNPKALEIEVHGKTGHRFATTMPNAVDIWKKQIELTGAKRPADYVFFPGEKDRKKVLDNAGRLFNVILEEGDLKLNSQGKPRSLYSLRHYCLQQRLIESGGQVNLHTLCKSSGTSLEMLEKFYLKHMAIGPELARNLQVMHDDGYTTFADGTRVKKRAR